MPTFNSPIINCIIHHTHTGRLARNDLRRKHRQGNAHRLGSDRSSDGHILFESNIRHRHWVPQHQEILFGAEGQAGLVETAPHRKAGTSGRQSFKHFIHELDFLAPRLRRVQQPSNKRCSSSKEGWNHDQQYSVTNHKCWQQSAKEETQSIEFRNVLNGCRTNQNKKE